VPLFAAALIFYERKPKTLLYVAVCFLAPCVYWYARNLILTGDPLNPIGGRIFGFSNWNADDYALQFEDLKNRSAWPGFVLWAALVVPFLSTFRNTQSMRHAMVFAAYSVVIWIVTSHYPRYLMPAFPVLALLAASGWHWLGLQGQNAIRGVSKMWTPGPRLASTGGFSLVVIVCFASSFHIATSWRKIAPTDSIRNEILENKIAGYQMLSDLKIHPVGRIYQFGIGEFKYYAPNPIWGDYFGPWRYSDFAPLEPAQLARSLKTHDFGHMLVHAGLFPEIASRPGFNDYFKEIRSDGAVKLYRIMDQGSHTP